jgi:hypothetical protein
MNDTSQNSNSNQEWNIAFHSSHYLRGGKGLSIAAYWGSDIFDRHFRFLVALPASWDLFEANSGVPHGTRGGQVSISDRGLTEHCPRPTPWWWRLPLDRMADPAMASEARTEAALGLKTINAIVA